MKTKTIKLYEYSELSDKAKARALNKLRESATDYEWWEPIYEDAATIGLRITAFDLDRNRHAEGEFMVLGGAKQVAELIQKAHGKKCETYKTASNYLAERVKLEKKYPNREDEEHDDYELFLEENGLLEDEFLAALLKDYSVMLQEESEYLTSDEAIIEMIEANEYTFTEDGVMENA